ncbi:MAG: TIM barrel protein [Clostridia bacterium]|nr:TIM barrel protein [Clostridia bacterium]
MKYSVCIDALFNGKDFQKSMKKVSDSGMNSMEFWSWWDKDIDSILVLKNELEMEVTAFCTRFISLTDPSRREEYIRGLKESILVAKSLDCKKLITQVGDELTGISREEQHRSIVDGLKACISVLEKNDITLVFEPLNTLVDHKGYYLSGSDEAFKIEEEVGSRYVKVLYDIYHQQITEGNIISTIEKNIEKIGHFHCAGIQGRHELDQGELNYRYIFDAIDKTSYQGYMGLEYFPLREATEGLEELQK